ncbi:G2/mitotic-specific cyclin S13-7-like [Syzygium oleosum]|uniref:G2/mitotic-specific cyclin S13-7-like n=1 Tax=Syzygium oleosum TaxID=219896 RepID=UPI0011D19B67|nr:G2/mitotic-specific cyclin S13-7-like [Syzygium oleosum]XP_056168855.1 G2/mitotic-specific cyclin S13-7-like [Syzygium oleosum]
MAARAVGQQPRGGENQKNVAREARHRRVLQDIGNLVSERAAQAKPGAQISRPVTRNFEAQLLAKAQAAQKDKKIAKEVVDCALANKRTVTEVTAATKEKALDKPVPEPVVVISSTEEENGKVAVRRGLKEAVDRALANKRTVTEVTAATKEKALDKPVPESVVMISSTEEENCKVAVRRVLKEGSSKKKSLTSVLTARSKAACGLANKPKDCLVDIDEADANDELAMVEYIDDIYKFYKLTEGDGRAHDYMDNQLEINVKMRMILMDWLIEVHRKFELMPETLYLTVNIVDRYLSMKVVRKRELQLVGISAMLIASKYEEIWAPEVNDFVFISDNAYVREQVLVMEKSILEKLEWYLTVPTPYVFLIRYIKASNSSDKEMENMVLFLAELGLMHYSTIILYCPSMIAASAVYAARCTLGKHPFWTETLKHHTGYSADQLMECAKLLVGLHSAATESKLKAAYRKFSSPDRGGVALLAPAKSLSAEAP